jgi:hypothetical protein
MIEAAKPPEFFINIADSAIALSIYKQAGGAGK